MKLLRKKIEPRELIFKFNMIKGEYTQNLYKK